MCVNLKFCLENKWRIAYQYHLYWCMHIKICICYNAHYLLLFAVLKCYHGSIVKSILSRILVVFFHFFFFRPQCFLLLMDLLSTLPVSIWQNMLHDQTWPKQCLSTFSTMKMMSEMYVPLFKICSSSSFLKLL